MSEKRSRWHTSATGMFSRHLCSGGGGGGSGGGGGGGQRWGGEEGDGSWIVNVKKALVTLSYPNRRSSAI